MIKHFKEQLKLRRLQRTLRARIRADKEFLRSTREEFLSLAGQRARVTGFVPLRHAYPYAYRFAGFVVVVAISMTSGLAAFAAKNDVPPDHPLYELKRLTEQVELKVSSPVKKVELHEKFARRRLREIVSLEEKVSKTREVRIKKLREEFKKEKDAAEIQTRKLKLNKERREEVKNLNN